MKEVRYYQKKSKLSTHAFRVFTKDPLFKRVCVPPQVKFRYPSGLAMVCLHLLQCPNGGCCADATITTLLVPAHVTIGSGADRCASSQIYFSTTKRSLIQGV